MLIYDKKREMAKRGRADPVLEAIWAANGWDGEAGTFGVEARYQPEYLRDRGVETIGDLHAARCGLSKGATEWVREVVPNLGNTQDRERWPVSADWAFLQNQVFPGAEPAPKVSRDRTADAAQLLKQSIGTMAAAMARLRAGGVRWHGAWDIAFGDGTIGYSARDAVARFAEISSEVARAWRAPSSGDCGVIVPVNARLRSLRATLKRTRESPKSSENGQDDQTSNCL